MAPVISEATPDIEQIQIPVRVIGHDDAGELIETRPMSAAETHRSVMKLIASRDWFLLGTQRDGHEVTAVLGRKLSSSPRSRTTTQGIDRS